MRTPVCCLPQTTAHTSLQVSSKTFQGCIMENKLYGSHTQVLIKILPILPGSEHEDKTLVNCPTVSGVRMGCEVWSARSYATGVLANPTAWL